MYTCTFLLKTGNGYLSSPVLPRDFDIINKDPKVNFTINAGQEKIEVWIPDVTHTAYLYVT